MEITIFGIIILPHATTIIVITVLNLITTLEFYSSMKLTVLLSVSSKHNFMHCQGAITHNVF